MKPLFTTFFGPNVPTSVIKRYPNTVKRIVTLQVPSIEHFYVLDRGGTVVKVLCYKSEGRWFDPKIVSL